MAFSAGEGTGNLFGDLVVGGGAASLRPLQGQHQGLHLLIETKSSSPGWARRALLCLGGAWCVPMALWAMLSQRTGGLEGSAGSVPLWLS